MNKQMLIYSPLATQIIAAGRAKGMRFRVLEKRKIPGDVFYDDGWWYEVLKPDSEYTIHPNLQERLDVIPEVGIQIEALIYAHEAPKLLTAPIAEKSPKNTVTDTNHTFDATPVLEAIAKVLGAFLAIVGIVVVTAIRLDPALIAVLPDGTFLEVATWYS